ncbi:HET-domain-containing protein [Polyplosphaeria fusca]|uniref:HET-domain-containing protein n=1 Tax=Polyplosphaeria fusca TaxID=682080 RepID=A0A9P4QT66_9PLEO|nr:HET-domain-containing protein [Polyplosphaeria fusca]
MQCLSQCLPVRKSRRREPVRRRVSDKAGAAQLAKYPASIYQPLPEDRYIRVLELFPGRENDPIECGLRILSLRESKGKYEAISYVWGDDGDTTDITCNGGRKSITRNLASALLTFRHAEKSRMLWADAICINQGDKEEKGHQVQQMDKVFESASHVLVWLGLEPKNCDAEDSFRLIQETNRYLNKFFAQQGGYPSDLPHLPTPHQIDFSKRRWDGVEKLFDNAWFTRVWVVQEAAVAKSCTLNWGKQKMSVAHAYELALWCNTKYDFQGILEQMGISLPFGSLTDIFWDIHSRYAIKDSWQSSLPLLEWELDHIKTSLFLYALNAAKQLNASDDRDYVYAFLGHPYARVEGEITIVTPNYGKSVENVYFELASALLRHPREAPWVLAYVKYHSLDDLEHSSLPSWVPCWNQSRPEHMMTNPNYWYRAGGDLSRFSPTVRPDRCLELDGFVFDEVVWASRRIYRQDVGLNMAIWSRDLMSARKPLIQIIWEEVSQVSQISEDQFSRALVQNYSTDWKKDAFSEESHRKDYQSYLRHARALIEGEDLDWEDVEDERRAGVFANNAKYAHNRRIVITKNGRIGVVPGLTRVDDVCCIFLGATTPFIIKPASNGTYKLIGDAYIHDTMDGEVLELLESGQLKREKLVIS